MSEMDNWGVPQEAQDKFKELGINNLDEVLGLPYEHWINIPLAPFTRSKLLKGLLKKKNMHWLEWANLSQYKAALTELGASDDVGVLWDLNDDEWKSVGIKPREKIKLQKYARLFGVDRLSNQGIQT